jgi:hypothetical protein
MRLCDGSRILQVLRPTMSFRRAFLCALIAVVCHASLGEPRPVPKTKVNADSPRGQFDVTRDQAVEILSTTDTFADTYVGFVGGPSRQACAFRRVLDQPDADKLFKQILAKAPLAGRLYALCGLYFTDHEHFLRVIQPYRESADSVATFQGCIYGRAHVASLVELADRGQPKVVRLRELTETTAEWLKRTRDSASQDYRIDILGGGWPARFREMKGCDR